MYDLALNPVKYKIIYPKTRPCCIITVKNILVDINNKTGRRKK